MRRIIEKFITVLLTMIICFNSIFPIVVYAETVVDEEELRKQAFSEFDHAVYLEIKRLEKEENKHGDDLTEGIRKFLEYAADVSILLKEETNQAIDDNWPGIYTQLDAYREKILLEEEQSLDDYIIYVKNNASQDPTTNIPTERITINGQSELKDAARKYLNKKMLDIEDEYEIEIYRYKQRDYLLEFIDIWNTELQEEYDFDYLISVVGEPVCRDSIEIVVNEFLDKFKDLEALTLTEAKNLIFAKLDKVWQEVEKEINEEDDDNIKKQKIIDVFRPIQTQCQNKRGDLYEYAKEIHPKIYSKGDKEKFLNNIPGYVEEYYNSKLPKTEEDDPANKPTLSNTEYWIKLGKTEIDYTVYEKISEVKKRENIKNIFNDDDRYKAIAKIVYDELIYPYPFLGNETVYISQATLNTIRNCDDSTSIIEALNIYYLGLGPANNQEFIDYITGLDTKDVPSKPEEPGEIVVITNINEFREAVENFLKTKLENFDSDYGKRAYLLRFKLNWNVEITGAIDIPGDLIIYAYDQCEEVCKEVADEMLKEFGDLEILTLDEAKMLIKEELKRIKEEKVAKYAEEGLDQDTLNLRLIEEFDIIKAYYTNKTGDLYNIAIAISYKIEPVESQSEFLKKIPDYIDEFLDEEGIVLVASKDSIWDTLSVTVDAITGILIWPVRVLFIVVPGAVTQLVGSLLANVGSEKGFEWLTLDDIFFNNLPLTDIDIFNFKGAAGSTISENNVLYKIRTSVSGWYYAVRNLCIALSLAVLVYIGIRMAISSIASERAKYKKMFKDWVVSIALIFFLHYFMILVITANNGLVSVLNKTRLSEETKLAQELVIEKEAKPTNMQDKMLVESLTTISFIKGMGYSLLYLMVVAMTLLFLIVYIKRMITLCFLATIAPIITVTYAIDKAGDGKAQALGKWMSEFVFNILIQPFHCIIYMVFLQNIFYVINNAKGVAQVGKIVVAMALLGFVYKAEDIIKEIFGFKTSSLSSAAIIGAAALAKAQSAASKAKGFSKAGNLAKGVNGIKNPKGLPSSAKNMKGPAVGKSMPGEGGGLGRKAKSDRKQGKMEKMARGAAKGVYNANKKTGKFIANHVLGAAMAYGMTGDAAKAYGAHELVGNAKNKVNKARANSAIRERQELTKDAYLDYAEHKGLATKQDRLSETERIMKADPDTLDDAEKNYAEWLHADMQMYEMMGSKDPMKDVLKELSDYEDDKI